MTPNFADTAHFVALYTREDSLHAKAVEWEALTDEIVTTEFILVEVSNFFRRPGDRQTFASFDAALRSNRRATIIPVATDLYQRGLQLFAARPDKGWSLTDCISFEVMTELELTDALTSDHHFTQAGFTALLLESEGAG